LVLSFASFSFMNFRISSAMSSSLAHCSLACLSRRRDQILNALDDLRPEVNQEP
jgi:hypothetical protein